MSALHEWWFEVLVPDSEIAINQGLEESDEASINKSYMLVAMNSYCKEHYKHFKPWTSVQFGMEFPNVVPGLKTHRTGSKPREWVIPPLKKCREYFNEKFGVGFDEGTFLN